MRKKTDMEGKLIDKDKDKLMRKRMQTTTKHKEKEEMKSEYMNSKLFQQANAWVNIQGNTKNV